MAENISDAEMQLALELSKCVEHILVELLKPPIFDFVITQFRRTYEEEERRRDEANDLIRFESPEAPIRREQINQIKRLYSQPCLESEYFT